MNNDQQVSNSELELMKIIWNKNGAAFLAEIMEELKQTENSWNQNTILTFLVRLVDKKMLKVQKINRKNRYIAVVSKNEFAVSQVKNFLDKINLGNVKDFASALIEQDYLSDEDIKELKEFWDKGKE